MGEEREKGRGVGGSSVWGKRERRVGGQGGAVYGGREREG